MSHNQILRKLVINTFTDADADDNDNDTDDADLVKYDDDQ